MARVVLIAQAAYRTGRDPLLGQQRPERTRQVTRLDPPGRLERSPTEKLLGRVCERIAKHERMMDERVHGLGVAHPAQRARLRRYTRIVKVGRRRGDNAPMVIVELLQESEDKVEAGKPAGEAEKKPAGPKAQEVKGEAAAAAPAAAAEPEKKKPARAKKKAAGEGEGEAESQGGEEGRAQEEEGRGWGPGPSAANAIGHSWAAQCGGEEKANGAQDHVACLRAEAPLA